MATESVLISDLYVQCSLQMINFQARGVCMSDCCGRNANSGVVMPDGKTMWRCRIHEGMVNFRTGDKGEIVFAIDREVRHEG